MIETSRPTPLAMLDRTGRVALDLACRKCGRKLRAMLPEDACPQCDLSVARSLSETLDAEGRVQPDVACLKCGYNLRSLTLDGRCPECGSPVADSVRGDLLEFADPGWVAGLAAGAELLLASGIGAVIAIACDLLAALLFESDRATSFTIITAAVVAIACTGAIVVPLLALGGFVKLAAREPRPGLRPEGLSARCLCWYSLVAFIPLAGAYVLAVALSGRVSPYWATVSLMVLTLIVVFGALPVSLLWYLAALFRRVPNSGHAAMARGLSLGILVADGIIMIPFVAGLFNPRIASIASITYLGVLILAGCGLGLLGVLYYARADFANAADRARARAGIAAVDQAAGDHRED